MSIEKTILVETQYFPPIELFAHLMRVDILQIEANEHYQKRAYRNRCKIAGPNGVQMLSVPLVKGKNQQQNIKDVKIAYSESWQKGQWKSIQTAYGKSPFFEYYADDIRPFFEKHWTFLFDLNFSILENLKDLLNCNFKLESTNEYLVNTADQIEDWRNKMKPKLNAEINTPVKFYPQVFEAKNGFIPNLSILDLLFCVGPEVLYYLDQYPDQSL